MARKPTDMVQLKIRVPEDLRQQLAKSAEANRRTLTTEILFRLESTYHDDLVTKEIMAAIEGGLIGRLNDAMKRAQAARDEAQAAQENLAKLMEKDK